MSIAINAWEVYIEFDTVYFWYFIDRIQLEKFRTSRCMEVRNNNVWKIYEAKKNIGTGIRDICGIKTVNGMFRTAMAWGFAQAKRKVGKI